ncbi:hypothetical protein ASG33_03625 [Dyadobacter sp. Leaf189]|nr:hypothetical protein ASG33_03625 [Dyadobacter sp. Leaf189]
MKCFDVFEQKILNFQRIQEIYILIQYGLIEFVFHVPSFFFYYDQIGICELFDVVRNGRLGQVYKISYFMTVQTIFFLTQLL